MPAASDEDTLLERARASDPEAFAALVTLHKARVWSVCLRITANQYDAEDALQEALLAAWRNLDRFRGDARFSTWLHRIAANASLAQVRRKRDVPAPGEGLDAADPVDDFGAVDEADRVEAALRAVPEPFRVALVLRVYGDLSYDEIAQHQGIGVQTVKTRIHRARRLVAEQLAS